MSDKIRQFGRSYHKYAQNSGYNTRRVSENFPFLERKVDIIDYEYPFQMEFKLSDHSHTVTLNLSVKPPEMFRCAQAIPRSDYSCVATGYSYNYESSSWSNTYLEGVITVITIESGDARPVIYSSFSSNIGDWELYPDGGVVVPKAGYYNVNFTTGSAYVAQYDASAAIASVRRNGIIASQVIYSVGNGRLNLGYGNVDINMWGLCIFANEGDILGGWMSSSGLYGASFTSGSTSIAMIGTE